jgi:hypothetical protein
MSAVAVALAFLVVIPKGSAVAVAFFVVIPKRVIPTGAKRSGEPALSEVEWGSAVCIG